MKVYLISNNLLLDGLGYNSNSNLDLIRLIRPLNIEGEKYAKKLAEIKDFQNVEKIYASCHSSAVSSAKYLANKLELEVNITEELNDCKVGFLDNKNMKMVKGLQEHDFNYKLVNGESLNDVGKRLNQFVLSLIDKDSEAIIFTHKRAILGFLLQYANVGYNLDDSLIVEFNDKIIYDDSETELDIYELIIENNKIENINRM